jgi:MFS family permease
VLPRLRGLAPALAVLVAAAVILTLTIVLIPVAAFLLVRWSLIGVVSGAEGGSALGLLRRSAALARGHWWRVASIVLLAAAALLLGPAVGVLVLLFTGAAFDLVNLIAALVYVAALPFAAVVTAYLHLDLRERQEAARAEEPASGRISTA